MLFQISGCVLGFLYLRLSLINNFNMTTNIGINLLCPPMQKKVGVTDVRDDGKAWE